jgi:hypothetical protein
LGDTTLCDQVCQRLAAGWWFSPGTSVTSTNKTEHYDITEILLKVALNIILGSHRKLAKNKTLHSIGHQYNQPTQHIPFF